MPLDRQRLAIVGACCHRQGDGSFRREAAQSIAKCVGLILEWRDVIEPRIRECRACFALQGSLRRIFGECCVPVELLGVWS